MSHENIQVRALSVYLEPGSHPDQEDHVLVNQENGIFAVADGFGGPISGAAASKVACEAVRNFLEKEAGDLDATLPFVLRSYFSLAGNVLFNALIHANKKVLKENTNKDVHEKGGASIITGYLDGDLLALASVGTCTAFLIREGRCVELVTPKGYRRLCDPFSFQEENFTDVPLMALGIVDDLEPEINEYKVRQGDWLILATDGVGRNTVEQLALMQTSEGSPNDRLQSAVNVLKEGRPVDNAAASIIVF